jgi:hypothetical protein
MNAGGWFVVDKSGRQEGVYDKLGAQYLAEMNDRKYPSFAPHRAVQLVELTPEIAAAGELLASLRECVEDTEDVIARHVEAHGETYRPARLKGMREQLARARAAIAKATGQEGGKS